MFAFLRGVIQSKEITGGTIDRLVLDVVGVGFELWMSTRTVLSIGQLGDEVIVHTWMSIRETEITLFGFQSAEERKLFQLLQTVNGVGPRLALSIVGTLGVKTVIDAILSEDTKTVSQTPGVGPKVAQRIVLELQTKVEEFAAKIGAGSDVTSVDSSVKQEVRSILEGAGYTGTEIAMALKKAEDEEILSEDVDVESIVRFSLKVLGSKSLV